MVSSDTVTGKNPWFWLEWIFSDKFDSTAKCHLNLIYLFELVSSSRSVDNLPNSSSNNIIHHQIRSFEAFIDAVQQINSGKATANDYEEELASVASTYRTTAILEAGRRSLDEKKSISILYDDVFNPCRPSSLAWVVGGREGEVLMCYRMGLGMWCDMRWGEV